MPAQKRKDLAGDGSDEEKRGDEEVKEEEVVTNGEVKSEEAGVGREEGEEVKEMKEEEKEDESKVPPAEMVPDPTVKQDESDAEGNSQSSNSAGDGDEFVLVKLAEIRKEVQCPICLGIIRKTRTVMECLHRFCRDCIDKSMRLSNNECPACRTHCASRRSLRDDPNFDALISALYPDIDKYEEEELAFSEEERSRNRKIQDSIAETFRRQTEALGKRKQLSGSRARNPRRRTRGRGRPSGRSGVEIIGGSEEEEMEMNGNVESNRDSESDDADVSPPVADVSRPVKRSRRKSVVGNSEEEQNGDSPMTAGSSASPAKAAKDKEKEPSPLKAGSKELTGVGSSPLKGGNKELTGVSLSPLRAGNMEVLSWGKNGARSQTRHGASGSLAGRLAKGSRVAKLIEHLRSFDGSSSSNEVEVQMSLVPLDEWRVDRLEMLYVCCKQTVSVQQLCELIAVKLKEKADNVEIYAKRHQTGFLHYENSAIKDESQLEILQPEKCISEIHASFSAQGNLQLVYGVKGQKVLERR
ncbi:hypothetical protein LUZ60_001448 [Juncus effusus]|nr:hypothetical protein LUZ60_001448 [Juncus effusus]